MLFGSCHLTLSLFVRLTIIFKKWGGMLYSVFIYVGCRCTCSLTTLMCQHCSCLVHFYHRNMLTNSSVWSVWSTPSHRGERGVASAISHISMIGTLSQSHNLNPPSGGEEGGDSAGSASRRQTAHFALSCSVTTKIFFFSLKKLW